MPRKFSDENERTKRSDLTCMREAKGYDPRTVDKASAAILGFEESIGFRSFNSFRIERVISSRSSRAEEQAHRQGPVAATVDATLRAVKAFFHWLASLAGYKSRIAYPDPDYFNLGMKASPRTRQGRPTHG